MADSPKKGLVMSSMASGWFDVDRPIDSTKRNVKHLATYQKDQYIL